jgi:hypothetical protein
VIKQLATRKSTKDGLMKKKDKVKKKPDMPEFSFKEFTPEEGKIYEDSILKFREAVAAGKTLKQAYESYPIEDTELRSLIQADFLKILIAERHFAQSQPLNDIAQSLGISPDLVRDTHARMLQEVGITAANQFGQDFGTMNPHAPKSND